MYADPANEDASVVDTIIEIDPSPVIFSAGSTSIVIRAPPYCVVTVHCRREPIAARPRHPPALHAVSDPARFHQSLGMQSGEGISATVRTPRRRRPRLEI